MSMEKSRTERLSAALIVDPLSLALQDFRRRFCDICGVNSSPFSSYASGDFSFTILT